VTQDPVEPLGQTLSLIHDGTP
jgi:hypothetical protein